MRIKNDYVIIVVVLIITLIIGGLVVGAISDELQELPEDEPVHIVGPDYSLSMTVFGVALTVVALLGIIGSIQSRRTNETPDDA